MTVFTFLILSYFKYNGIKFSLNPTNGPELFGVIATKILIVRMRPNFLYLIKAYSTFRIIL